MKPVQDKFGQACHQQEPAQRRDEALRRALQTPPKPKKT